MMNLSIPEGQIKKITNVLDALVVEFTDWQENLWEIIFQDVFAYQNIGAEREDFAELIVVPETNLSEYIKKIAPKEEKKSYCFISAWTNFSVLTILAENYIVKKIN